MKVATVLLLSLLFNLQAIENKKNLEMIFTYELSQNRSFETVTLREGTIVTFLLETKLSTGYDWKLEQPASSVIEVLEDSAVSKKPDLPVLGGSENHLFKFRAVKKGNAILTFLYKRSWGKNIDPIKTLNIKVVVNEEKVQLSE